MMMGISLHRSRGIVVPVALFAGIGLAGCNKAPPAKMAKNPRVVVTSPITDTVIDYQDFTGRMEAVKTIEIRSRVTGYAMEIPFKEGDLVSEGSLLAQIDKRPYEADWKQTEANVNLAIAERNLQEKIYKRIKSAQTTASSMELETSEATVEKAKASVAAMEAAKDRAKLYLDYTRVTWERSALDTGSPRVGRIGRRFVDPGNLILADNTIIATIVTESPMYAYFDVDERTYLDLVADHAPGQHSWVE
jgi:multidrug efflux system membrane fusion protein